MSEQDLLFAGLGLLAAGWALLANRHELARFERWSWGRLGVEIRGEDFTVKTTSAAGVLSLVTAAFVLLSAFSG
jgi:uncharacterized membrane protein